MCHFRSFVGQDFKALISTDLSISFGHVYDTRRKGYLACLIKGKLYALYKILCTIECNCIFNPRSACARVTALVLSCVCLSVCLCVFPIEYSGTSRNQAYKQQYQRLQRDTGMKYKKGFFFKTLRSEVMASFTHLE